MPTPTVPVCEGCDRGDVNSTFVLRRRENDLVERQQSDYQPREASEHLIDGLGIVGPQFAGQRIAQALQLRLRSGSKFFFDLGASCRALSFDAFERLALVGGVGS